MNSKLEALLEQLNPLNDFDHIRFYNVKTHSNEKLKTFGKNLSFFPTVIKPFIRGHLVGAAVGTLASIAAGKDLEIGAIYGALITGQIDIHQYLIRGAYYYMKEQFFPQD